MITNINLYTNQYFYFFAWANFFGAGLFMWNNLIRNLPMSPYN
ncbi:hypothetical protein SpAn4DRAFT_0678 [Sporomusa ovata]|uniref:Uncharacterized protein n=1 Tax=Sporomusa ovata TaxID=2378 RepID=A0A0U1L3H5_9FIRM|nr:hypothetical protein SpAn4DRAFT_0678 [Sporomusa ovata]